MQPGRPAPLFVYDVVSSTNDTLRRSATAGAPEGTTHLALSQRRGRGRAGHSWWSPRGRGVWMSVLLRPAVDRSLWPGLSLVAGVAVHDTLRELGVEAPELYWPNDIEVGGRKICGILGESHADGEAGWITMGIGLNIDLRGADSDSATAVVRERATSLVECAAAKITEPRAIARSILEHLWPLYEAYKQGVSVPDLVGQRLAHLNGPVHVRLPETESWPGTIRGITPRGELLIEPRDGIPKALTAFRQPDNLVALAGGQVIYESA